MWEFDTKTKPLDLSHRQENDVLTGEVKGAIHALHYGAISSPTHGYLLKRCFGLTVAYWIM